MFSLEICLFSAAVRQEWGHARAQLELHRRGVVFEFDLRQFHTGYREWIRAFEEAVARRSGRWSQRGIFIGQGAHASIE